MAKIAVSAATYWIDKPYEYLVPEEFVSKVDVGYRVLVPFSRGNRLTEGVVLALSEKESEADLKSVAAVLDTSGILSPEQIQLALFMRERFFCTIYDAVKSMLPTGLWFGDDGKMRIRDKTVEIARLLISGEDAASLADSRRKKAPQQANLLAELAVFGELSTGDLLRFTGASKTSLDALKKAGVVEYYYRETFRRPEFLENDRQPLPVLNDDQQQVFAELLKQTDRNEYSVSLLQGVTGSGKTSVYTHLIQSVLDAGKTAILLVPEIALTPQMVQTFSSYFGDDIAILHSGLSSAERYDEWKRVKSGMAHLVIGTRSAVFAPCENLGLVIIDEEQEESYKSENNPRYNAEDIAKYRCWKSGCMLLLGSATPKISTRFHAEKGTYSFCRLNRRYNEMQLPQVRIVDMKQELKRGNAGNISSFLKDELQRNIDNGEQSILFLNRRGANRMVTCVECGYVYKCPHCSVSLTYHSVNGKMICHYCGYRRDAGKNCPECGGTLKNVGAGTQLVEEELKELFPETSVMRIDTDALTGGISHRELFDSFRTENIPIMIGTQMVTKGLNFKNVTLVGVISADQSLYAPDFRASERCFSLLTQVIGRSGRGEKPGRAVIQTFTPENEVILQAAAQDYDAFYESEILMREIESAPPYADYLTITASGIDEESVMTACTYAKLRLEFLLKDRKDVELLGPAPLSVVKVNNRFRYRVIVRSKADSFIRKMISQTMNECSKDKRFKKIVFYADNDPND